MSQNSTLTPAAREHLLAFADDEHMVGARHTNWIGLGPFLEEDLAFCSIAQDELGHAIGLYEIILDDDAERDVADLDAFAMMRPAAEYRSCWLAEIECSAWSDSLVRHWLYDRAEDLRWGALIGSSDQRVAALAARARREESFHMAHAEQFLSRLAATDQVAHIVSSIDRLFPIAKGMFDPLGGEEELVADGFVAQPAAELAAAWEQNVGDDLARWGLDLAVPTDDVTADQRGRTVRSAGFDEFQAGLQRVITVDPIAVW